jgi:membrane protein YdbS with pleckstrin-like domain
VEASAEALSGFLASGASSRLPALPPRPALSSMTRMGYPKKLLTEGEEIVKEFRPHWRMLVVPFGWTALLIAAVVLTWIYPPSQNWFDWGITGIAGVAWLVLGLYPLISWFFTLYVLTNERLIHRSGIITRHGLEIPLEQVNDLSFHQTVLERVLRCGDLVIESAGEKGQSVLSNIPDPEEFHSLLYKVREDRSIALKGGQPSPQGSDSVSQLERLAQLQRDGMITREEYEEQKRKILGQS